MTNQKSKQYNRRDFLKAGGAGIGALALSAGTMGIPGMFETETAQAYSNIDGVKSSDFPRKDGEADDTKRLRRLIKASEYSGWVPIHLNENNAYVISDTILIDSGDKKPLIFGKGFRRTVISGENLPAGKPAIKVHGGWGMMTGGMLFGVGFRGNENSIGIEVAGVNGFRVDFCQFELNQVGIMFHNGILQEFTEGCIASYCDFRASCKTAVEYKQSNNVESFHGTGIKSCTINQGAGETEPKIKIGKDCIPFNAPLEFNIWTRGETPIIKNEGNEPATFYGTISIESFDHGDSGYKVEMVSKNDSPVYLIGSVSALDDQSQLGNLVLCDRVQINPDRTINVQRKRYQNAFQLMTGANPTISVTNGVSSIVSVYLQAANYNYAYTLLVYRNVGDDKGTVTNLSLHQNHNAAMYYGPTFSIESGKLVITNKNFPDSGVTANISVLDIGSRFQYFMM
ncbi:MULTISPECIES: twin-arginine translocation signal domain-containing protein [Bacillus]|uniref:Twin-arginine translocation signal domain-containing protein n=2 Tax=Bacillus TaxID=1386 RepID=A0A0M5JJ70_9BACI|nr:MULTISPECIES: twin-arginine translocation signal domain-containing protein [Bacillus]ALC82569.1 hypothetical protein AM592_14030 [Bacillus gobiensis]MBP1081492.1 hypothetical protein [Bacillus capparidis]MED1096159.1 twin-arginine translocation signal domain-containing protein [Bacillus capparidis]